MKTIIRSAVAAVALAVFGVTSGAALAAPMKPPVVQPTCSILSVTTSTACQTVLDNNDSASDMNGFNLGAGVFGVNTWIFADRAEDGSSPTSPYNLTGYVDAKTGTWSVDSFNNYSFAALVMKGGGEAWVAYLLDLTKLSGTWSTADLLNDGGKQPNLSHMTLYVGGEQMAPIPLPAAGLLLVGAIGGLAALRRRKAQA